NERSTSSPGLPIAASTCRCISAASFSRKSRSVAISVQEWVVNFVCYSLLILCPRFVQIIHRGIQTHKVGEGGRTARVKRRSSRLAVIPFSYCPKYEIGRESCRVLV